MWHLINKIVKKKAPAALHHSPAKYAQSLNDVWSAQSKLCSLPVYVQDALSSGVGPYQGCRENRLNYWMACDWQSVRVMIASETVTS